MFLSYPQFYPHHYHNLKADFILSFLNFKITFNFYKNKFSKCLLNIFLCFIKIDKTIKIKALTLLDVFFRLSSIKKICNTRIQIL